MRTNVVRLRINFVILMIVILVLREKLCSFYSHSAVSEIFVITLAQSIVQCHVYYKPFVISRPDAENITALVYGTMKFKCAN
jgi:hypothetical protein